MARNYQPTLRDLLHLASVYIGRWRTLLLAGMTSEQASALAAFETALVALQSQLGEPPINP